MNHQDRIVYFAETDYRSKKIKFGIKEADRARHMYVIGKTGMGKSTLLENLAVQDIVNGNGIGFIDPHGSSAEELLNYIPEHRLKDVIYFAPFDQDHPIAFNVMEDIGKDQRPLVASGLLGAFKKVWVDAWSPRMEYLLNNAILALLEYPGSTLLGVNRMFSDKNYRDAVVANVQDPSVKAFWTEEFAKYNERYATEAAAAIQNKVGQFAANPLIRNMMGQSKSSFNIRDVMDKKKIFIANLSKGRIGEGNASLIGGMLITKLYLAAMSRADMNNDTLKSVPPFYLYVDEFQSFANESFADILSEARKYKLSLTIAHQYVEQMSEEVRAAVFGNVGTTISFRVGAFDAELMEKEFAPAFTAEDMVNLGFAQVYLKLMIDGIGSAPFSAKTLPRPERPTMSFRDAAVRSSQEQFATERAPVEEKIRAWHAPMVPQERMGDDRPRNKTSSGDRRMINDRPQTMRPPLGRAPRLERTERPERSDPPARQELPRPQFRSAPERREPVRREESVAAARAVTISDTGAAVEHADEPQMKKESPQPVAHPEVQTAPSTRAPLSHLTHKDKSPSARNVQSLKDALSAVMKNHEEAKSKDVLPSVQAINDVTKNMEDAKKATPIDLPKNEKPQEVPEHVLRDVLK